MSSFPKALNIHFISSGDDEIGQLIAEAMKVVGRDGVITVEESKTMKTELDTVEGMQFDRGFVSAYMVTDVDKMEAVLNDPFILITDKKISNIQEILPLLEQLVKTGKKLLIIAEDVVTTGKSTKETKKVLEELGGQVIGVACIANRTKDDIGMPIYSAIDLDIQVYDDGACPLCDAGQIDLVKPGSREFKNEK